MTDTTTYIHMGVTALTAITVAAFGAYSKFKSKKLDVDNVCHQDFQELKTKVAVLEERINNEVHLLEKLDDKLDEIRRQL